MNGTEMKHVLARLLSAYPGTMLDDETPRLWFDYLEPLDPDDVSRAAYAWIESERRFPSISAFLDMVHAEVTERHRATTRAALGSGEPTRTVEPDEGELFSHERKAAIAGLSSSLTLKEHNHREGADACAVCGPVIRREEHVHSGHPDDCPLCARTRVPEPERLYRCPGGCLDQGMVEEIDAAGRRVCRPCAACNRDSYDLWVNGCYALNHYGCELCRPSRRKRAAANT